MKGARMKHYATRIEIIDGDGEDSLIATIQMFDDKVWEVEFKNKIASPEELEYVAKVIREQNELS